MKIRLFFIGVMALLFLAVVSAGHLFAPTTVSAETKNYSEVVTGVQIISMPIMGQYTSTRTGLITFQIPFKAKVLGVSAKARASSGTTPTLSVDIKEDGVSILSTPLWLTSTSVSEATISDTTLADESTITLDLAIGGTSPVWQDIMTILTIRRTN